MSVRRLMGAETEFGISVLGHPTASPIAASTRIVNAYANANLRARRARWDFEEESPLRDARGFDMARGLADPSQLPDEDFGLVNLILTNGARFYVDHAHPEYSGPECLSPYDAVLWDKAGEQIVYDAARFAGAPDIALYKNNTDNKGASYGSHENYLMSRRTAFADIVRHLTPFFVSRQVVCGAGRVGIGQDGSGEGFQISQRADFFEVEVGLETTLKRPIINTRDEPHADPNRFRRLHVIIGDANLSEISALLKFGTTAMVLALIEADAITKDLTLANPVAALRAISHDPTLNTLVELRDGRRLTGVQLQWEYFELADAYAKSRPDESEHETASVLARWHDVLTALESDPMKLASQLDWVAKLALLNQYRDRDNLSWASPKLALVDLQYSDMRPGKGLHHKLVQLGRMETLFDKAQIDAAMVRPPDDTRAYFRGRCLEKFSDEIVAASWDSVIFDVPGERLLRRIPTSDPLRGTKAHVGDLLDRCENSQQLLAALGSVTGP